MEIAEVFSIGVLAACVKRQTADHRIFLHKLLENVACQRKARTGILPAGRVGYR
jgi:hypothetical protein